MLTIKILGPGCANCKRLEEIARKAASDLIGGYEGAWEKIRARFGAGAMPRTVNFVSGPSRTADIGGQLVMGAHGPRRLCVILVRT